jgi:hypothetical protein
MVEIGSDSEQHRRRGSVRVGCRSAELTKQISGMSYSREHPLEEIMMADDTTNRGEPDRSRVAAGEGYEVEYFARKHGITAEQARELIARIGNDRDDLDAAAAKLK